MSQECFPKVLAYPDAQETSDEPCDVGLEVTELEEMAAFNQWPIDLSLVKEGWNSRARDTRRWLRQKSRELVENGDEDVQIVLVTHGTFLHYFTEDWEDADTFPRTGWQNCESRSYEFANGVMNDLDAEARLTETIASRKKRGKSYPMYGIEQQAELFNLSMCQWRGQGF
ncbi:hypothetical protein E4T50_02767 [Aureobasidium sp. EXF-12298]|nr:hypothetical protein E4T50_02767 [Aureobasidium sp. EXF-12298]